jgi:hypothetical protein
MLPAGSSSRRPRFASVRTRFIPQRSRTGPSGHHGSQESQVIAHAATQLELYKRVVQIVLRRSRVAAPGSRRAADGVGNDRGARPQTVEDYDRRFARRRPLTWSFPPALMVLNSIEFHGETPSTDLARRKPGVQIPSPPPHPDDQRKRWSSSGSGPAGVAA